MIQYTSREGYKNLRIGWFRIVYARGKDSQLRNLTAYLYLDNDHMFDFTFSLLSFGFSHHKY